MISGFINVNKPVGLSSAAVVNRVKHIVRAACGESVKCGHMGTLDPLASGVLPVAVGNATRLFDYFLNKKKTYTANFEFGKLTDTLDCLGEVTAEGGLIPTAEQIEATLPFFIGKINQIPPKYSAKSVNGQRGYTLARQGKDFVLKPVEVEIFSFKLIERVSDSEYRFNIECSAGTYIRAIARDLGARLSTYATMTSLIRERSGLFLLEQATPLDLIDQDNIIGKLINVENVVELERLNVEGEQARRLYNGISIEVSASDGLYSIYNCGEYYGLGRVTQGVLTSEVKLV